MTRAQVTLPTARGLRPSEDQHPGTPWPGRASTGAKSQASPVRRIQSRGILSLRALSRGLFALSLLALSGCAEPASPRSAAPRSFLDRPVSTYELPTSTPGSVPALLRSSEVVWFVDKPYQPWNVFPATPPEVEPQLWRGVPSMPVEGSGWIGPLSVFNGTTDPAQLRRPESAMDLAALQPGLVLVDGRGIHLATRSRRDKPPTFRPAYTTASRAILDRWAPPAPAAGARVTAQHQTFGGESRRAARVTAGTKITWALAPSDAGHRVHLEHARDRWGLNLVPQPDASSAASASEASSAAAAVQINEAADAAFRFTLTWRADGQPSQLLWEATLGPDDAGAVHGAELPPLPAHAPGARLEFNVETLGAPPSMAGRAYWLDPALVPVPDPRRARPNVLLVVLDTLRADRLGCYGYERPTSPRIDAIARDGVLFERAWSAAPWTLPSHASLFSSLHAVEHGVFDASVRLPEEAETIAEVLFNAGYDTAAFTEAGYVRPELGLAQGFQRFRCALAEVDQTFGGAADWIEARERPFFAFVHTYKVHTPYDPEGPARELLVRPYDGPLPENARVDDVPAAHKPHDYTAQDARYLSDLYDAEIRELDEAFGDFMDRLRRSGALENTLVVITADHGEEFAEHGQFNHSNSLYEEQLRVPLILIPPGEMHLDLPATRSPRPTMSVDVAPTIAQVADAPVPAAWSGRSLLEPLREAPEGGAPQRWVLYRPSGSEELTYAVEANGSKFIRYPTELRPEDAAPSSATYDLNADAGERAPQVKGLPDMGTSLSPREVVRYLQGAFPRRWEGSGASSTPEFRAQLAELGYASGND